MEGHVRAVAATEPPNAVAMGQAVELNGQTLETRAAGHSRKETQPECGSRPTALKAARKGNQRIQKG